MAKRKAKRKERFVWPKAGPHDADIRRSSIVQIDWKDATSNSRWESNSVAPELVNCTSVGFLLKRAPSLVTLAGSFGNNDTHGDSISIPRAWIQRIKVIRRAP